MTDLNAKRRQALSAVLLTAVIMVLSGCGQQSDQLISLSFTVTFVNEIQEASHWFLPDTEENRKKSLWGEASVAAVSGLKTNQATEIVIEGTEESDQYLLRMIDTDQIYYAFDSLVLKEGCSLRFYRDSSAFEEVSLEVQYPDGEEAVLYSGFAGTL